MKTLMTLIAKFLNLKTIASLDDSSLEAALPVRRHRATGRSHREREDLVELHNYRMQMLTMTSLHHHDTASILRESLR